MISKAPEVWNSAVRGANYCRFGSPLHVLQDISYNGPVEWGKRGDPTISDAFLVAGFLRRMSLFVCKDGRSALHSVYETSCSNSGVRLLDPLDDRLIWVESVKIVVGPILKRPLRGLLVDI